MVTAKIPTRFGKLTVSAMLVVLALAVSKGAASADQGQVVTGRMTRTGGSSIALQPLTGDEDLLRLWGRKLPLSNDAFAVLPDGTVTKVSKVKSGSIVTARLVGEIRTTTTSVGCGILVTGTFGCGILAVPRKETFFDGSVSELRVLAGRCVTQKKVRLGGAGELTDVVLCRYTEDGEGFYGIVVNAWRADHAYDVIAALASGEVRISRSGSGTPPSTARFATQGMIATASLRSADAEGEARLDVTIYANGPHDGLDMAVYKVSSSKKL